MSWSQPIHPLSTVFWSALVAVIPLLYIFWALVVKKMKGHWAMLSAAGVAILVAILVYGMPIRLTFIAMGYGALYGLFPICWIVIGAIFIFNLTVKSGKFEIIKHFMSSLSADRRLQALLIAFSFGAFLEGTAGFGAPVAITATMLIGLGFKPIYAAGLCLVANTAPVAFGAVGIPITVAAQLTDLSEMSLSQMVGRTLPFLSLLIPLYLVHMISGLKKSMEVFPAILVSGGSFAFFQWLSANYFGPMLPDIIAGVLSMLSLIVFLKFWKPKQVWQFKEDRFVTQEKERAYSRLEVLRAWSPFLILTLMILAWGLQPVKMALDTLGQLQFKVPGLHDKIISGASGEPLPQVFNFNYLSASGTAIFISCLLSIPLVGLRPKEGWSVFLSTLDQLKFPILTIAAVLGFAYVVNNSGMSLTLASALASTGVLFPFFAPVLGWLGVFITGSDTSSNALFSNLQKATADSLGLNPVLTVSANSTGGVVGKMISPQSIAVAAAAGGLVGREADIFRFSIKHSFILLFLICILTVLQAYVFPGIIPEALPLSGAVTDKGEEVSKGFMYLIVLFFVLVCVMAFLLWPRSGRKA